MEHDGTYLLLTQHDIDNFKHTKKIINFDAYLSSGDDKNYSDYYLLINYCRTSIIGCRHLFCPELYKDEQSIETVNLKILNFPGKRILQIHDIHDYTFINGFDGFKNFCKNVNINLVIGNYIYNNESKIIYSILNDLSIKYCVIPNLVNFNVFKDYNNEKIYDILIYGSLGFCYPLRRRMVKLIEQNSKWKSRIISYNELTSCELSKEINKSYLSVSTCSTFEYLVCKYTEISRSNSLIIGNMPDQGKLLYGDDDFIHINNNMSDDEIINIINKTLENKEAIMDKIKNVNNKLEIYNSKYQTQYIHKCIDFFETSIEKK
jgi:hypothetical protein